ncbi:MAG TPA: BON domain-containing protein [Trebonia sp.]|nr:BON domain-containing protein [Trebonia sp.]
MTEDFYIEGRIKRALAEDPRTHELGVLAEIEGDTVVLRGEVAGAERRLLVAEVAATAAPGLIVRNEVSVTEVFPPQEEERAT